MCDDERPALPDVFTHSATVTAGETFVYSSNYSTSSSPSSYSHISAQRIKFLCKGEGPTTCKLLWDGEPVVSDDQLLSTVTVTFRAVTLAHNGTYWCGAQSVQGRRSNRIFYRLLLHVGKRGVTRSRSTLLLAINSREAWGRIWSHFSKNALISDSYVNRYPCVPLPTHIVATLIH